MINPQTLKNHIQELTKVSEPTPHTEILCELLKQFEPIDFEALTFPQVEPIRKELTELKAKMINKDGSNKDNISQVEQSKCKIIEKQLEKFKVTDKHRHVLSIENVLKIAKKNRWGLCKNQDFVYLYNGAYWTYLDNYKSFWEKVQKKWALEVLPHDLSIIEKKI